MKFICTFVIFALSSLSLMAQKTGDDTKGLTDTRLLPPAAFDKMIIQDITYAIFGESSPVSGIKVDISKPEATISGIFQPKKHKEILIGIEFKGGITDRSWSIFKGLNSFNTAFEFKPSLHYITNWNKAKYYTVNKPVLKAKNDLIETRTRTLIDTFHAVALIYNAYMVNYPKLLDETPTILNAPKDLVLYFVKKFTKKEEAEINTTDLTTILKTIPVAVADGDQISVATYKDDIIETYYKYEKLFKGAGEEQLSKQISNVSKAWSLKKYWWFTFSPFARTEKITEYHTKFQGLDSLYFKNNYPIYFGINAMLNHYRLFPNKRALFFRFGINLSRANNIASLSSFNYETRTPFFSSGSSVTQKTKTGTAYNKSQIKSGFASQVSGEFYFLPLKAFVPGFYLSSSVNNSVLYKLSDVVGREDDKTLIPIEGGLVFNINSREKDKEKNILSLSIYSRFEDVTDKRRTSKSDLKEETREDYMKRNFSIGIKFGIPITLPQRGD